MGEDRGNPWEGIRPFLNDDGNLVVKREGKEVELGPNEVIAELQKGFSGDARLRQAAEFQGRRQYADDVDSAMGGDRNAYFRLADARGIGAQEAAEFLEGFEQDEGDDEMADDEGQTGDPVDSREEEPEVRYVERPKSSEDVDRDRWVRNEQLQQIRNAIHSELDAGLDNDPRFGRLVKGGGQQAAEIREMARKGATRIVVSEKVEWSESVRGRVLDELAHTLEVFGLGADGTPPPPGTGPAPFSDPGILQPQQPRISKRPDHDSQDYEHWVEQTLQGLHSEALQAE